MAKVLNQVPLSLNRSDTRIVKYNLTLIAAKLRQRNLLPEKLNFQSFYLANTLASALQRDLENDEKLHYVT